MAINGNGSNLKKLKVVLDKITSYDTFLKFMYGKQDRFKEALFKAFPTNEFVSKYQNEHNNIDQSEEVKDKPVSKLSPGEIIKKNRSIQELLLKAPLKAPFIDWVGSKEYEEPRMGLFDKNPSRSPQVIEDIKLYYTAIQTNIAPKNLKYSKQNVRQMFDELNKKRKPDATLADLKTLLALHSWGSLKDQSSLAGKRTVLLDTLKHFCQALYLGGVNYLNATGFGQVFMLYIHNYFLELENESKDIDKNIALASSESEIKRHFEGLEALLRSAYHISPSIFSDPRQNSIKAVTRLAQAFELKHMGSFGNYSLDFKLKNLYLNHVLKAIQNVVHEKPKTAVNEINSDIYVDLYLNMLSYLAVIPGFNLGQKLVSKISTSNYEINLRLRSANTKYFNYIFFTSYWLDKDPELEGQSKTFSKGTIKKLAGKAKNTQTTRKQLDTLVKYCYETIDIIKENNKNRPLQKAYEHDPFIKAYNALHHYKNKYSNDIKIVTVYHKFLLQARYLMRGVAINEKRLIYKNARRMLAEITSSINKYRKEIEEKE